jgi:hypothetical protein
MEDYRHTGYPQEGVSNLPEGRFAGAPNTASLPYLAPAQPAAYNASPSAFSHQMSTSQNRLDDDGSVIKYGQSRLGNHFKQLQMKKLDKKWQRRLYW